MQTLRSISQNVPDRTRTVNTIAFEVQRSLKEKLWLTKQVKSTYFQLHLFQVCLCKKKKNIISFFIQEYLKHEENREYTLGHS